MQRYGLLAIISITGLLLGLPLGSGTTAAGPLANRLSAQERSLPRVLLTGLELADGVRYSVSLAYPVGPSLSDLQIEVKLPLGVEVIEAMETPDYTQLVGLIDGTLTWRAPVFDPGDNIDTFTFTLGKKASADLAVRVTWAGDAPGQTSFTGQPAVARATTTGGEVSLSTAVMQPIGDSGIQVGIASGAVLDGSIVRVRTLGLEANPPAAIGDLWWCSMVEVDGLPAGASLLVMAPLRLPLPPGKEVVLFAQSGGEWQQLHDRGLVTADSQYVAFLHPGGTVAAGTSLFDRLAAAAQLISTTAPGPTPTPIEMKGPPRDLPAAAPLATREPSIPGAAVPGQTAAVPTRAVPTSTPATVANAVAAAAAMRAEVVRWMGGVMTSSCRVICNPALQDCGPASLASRRACGNSASGLSQCTDGFVCTGSGRPVPIPGVDGPPLADLQRVFGSVATITCTFVIASPTSGGASLSTCDAAGG